MKILLLLILMIAPQKFVVIPESKPEPRIQVVIPDNKTQELDESLERHWQEIQSILDYGE